jgi:hypothetical protein
MAMSRVISYSLFGNNPYYLKGAIHNVRNAPAFYPGWETWVYIGDDVPSYFTDILARHASRILLRNRSSSAGKYHPLLWRFDPALDKNVELLIVRDCDSFFSTREVEFVHQWLDSGMCAHIIRDHPFHTSLIQAGMFGIRRSCASDLLDYSRVKSLDFDSRRVDEIYLARYVYPHLKGNVYYSTDYCNYEEKRYRNNRNVVANTFVGEAIFATKQSIIRNREIRDLYDKYYYYRVYLFIRQLPTSLFYIHILRHFYTFIIRYLDD